MNSKVYLDNDGIVRVTALGDQDGKEIIEVRYEILRLGKNASGKIKVLYDLSKIGKSLPDSRSESVKSLKLEELGNIALFGASAVIRVIASFIIRASGMSEKAKYFKTEEEALRWLKGQQ